MTTQANDLSAGSPVQGPAVNAAHAMLEVRSLRVAIRMPMGDVDAVRGVSFDLERGEALGVVGESGSGKTLTALSIMNLLPLAARIRDGCVIFEGKDLQTVKPREMREIRRHRIGYIPQDPHTALHPSFRIRRQIWEGLAHTSDQRKTIEARAIQILTAMGLSDAEAVLDRFPHELSGGMKQRIIDRKSVV